MQILENSDIWTNSDNLSRLRPLAYALIHLSEFCPSVVHLPSKNSKMINFTPTDIISPEKYKFPQKL